MTKEHLIFIRKGTGLNQTEFAQAVGITRELLNKMEAGNATITQASQLLIQHYLEGRKEKDDTQQAYMQYMENEIMQLRKQLADLESLLSKK